MISEFSERAVWWGGEIDSEALIPPQARSKPVNFLIVQITIFRNRCDSTSSRLTVMTIMITTAAVSA